VLDPVVGMVSAVRLLVVGGTVSMVPEFVPLVNGMVGILVLGVAYLCYWICKYED